VNDTHLSDIRRSSSTPLSVIMRGHTRLASSLLLFKAISSNAWLMTTTYRSGPLRLVKTHFQLSIHSQEDASVRYPHGEVIGSTGKIGSYILNSINSPNVPIVELNNHQYPQCQPAAATPRGVSPGCLSPEDTPLYACVPSSAIRTVWDATVPHRRKDLVFLCNCIPSRHLNNFDSSSDFTICILHFGVSHVSVNGKAASLSSQPLPVLNTSPQSPPTVVYGRHATTLAEILKRDGISVEIASSAQQLQSVAAKKLAWSSLFWLLCHDSNEPMTVKEVWEKKSEQIHALVAEMLPELERLAAEAWNLTESSNASTKIKSIGTVQEVVDYLHTYSMSMKHGQITPSLDLALNEIQERNGVLLSLTVKSDDTDTDDIPHLQLEMIRRVAGEECLAKCLSTAQADDISDGSNRLERVPCEASNLQFLYYPTKKKIRVTSDQSSVVIIGAGIIGSSVAHHLSRRGDFKITLLDKSTSLLPKPAATDQDDEIHPGVATSSSFAWLNANDKSPLSYMQLNQLGMEMWHRHDLLKKYPAWSGALLRKETQNTCEKNSRYVCIGPLDYGDAKCLEPGIDWKENSEQSSEFYFYPEEGFVEPTEVVKGLRLSAQRNGVDFIGGAEIASLIRNEHGNVSGVEYTAASGSTNIIRATADVVIIACGASSASQELGRLLLAKQPGALTYVSSGSYLKHPQTRIFVDTINQTHMLRRSDGTLVVGGGKLIVGGSEGSDADNDSPINNILDKSSKDENDSAIGKGMIAAAIKSVSPDELDSFMEHCFENDDDSNFRVTKANRPISADGLPVVGLVEQGLYVAVTHSGITLAPLIGELASYEIEDSLNVHISEQVLGQESYGFQILEAYRPTRFK